MIADKDAGKDERHQKLEESLDDRFHKLAKSREVENLLEPAIIEAVIRSYEGDACELKKFVRKDYEGKYLGSFIEKHLLIAPATSKRMTKRSTNPYAEKGKSGTLKDKPAFCDRAMKHLNNWSDISQEARDIAEKLGNFVIKMNKR